jgi:hypothetical protein
MYPFSGSILPGPSFRLCIPARRAVEWDNYGKGNPMKHLEITQQPEIVRDFVLAITQPPEDLIFENHGVPFARMTPLTPMNIDQDGLVQAILARRDDSLKAHVWAS